MGREALCRCQWGSESADAKVLLEGGELIVRGPIRRRTSVADLKDIAAKGDRLTFRVGNDAVVLTLGAAAAERWAAAIATPPPTLAKKLGIADGVRLHVVGKIDDDELRQALKGGIEAGGKSIQLIVARVNTHRELQLVFSDCVTELNAGIPLWIVYPKGPAQDLRESVVLEELRGHGMVDTKVAAVSTRLTAIRCTVRKQ